jgi:hypothetical protein
MTARAGCVIIAFSGLAGMLLCCILARPKTAVACYAVEVFGLVALLVVDWKASGGRPL